MDDCFVGFPIIAYNVDTLFWIVCVLVTHNTTPVLNALGVCLIFYPIGASDEMPTFLKGTLRFELSGNLTYRTHRKIYTLAIIENYKYW